MRLFDRSCLKSILFFLSLVIIPALFVSCGSKSPSGPTSGGPSSSPTPVNTATFTATVCGASLSSSYTFDTDTQCWGIIGGTVAGSALLADPTIYHGTPDSLKAEIPIASTSDSEKFGLTFTTPVNVPNGTTFSFWYLTSTNTTSGSLALWYLTTEGNAYNSPNIPFATSWTQYDVTMNPGGYPVSQIYFNVAGNGTLSTPVTLWIDSVSVNLGTSPTPTPTFTYTSVPATSPTPTFTDTTVPVATNTFTSVPSITSTYTFTHTPTNSFTYTSTPLVSPTATYTAIVTSTPTAITIPPTGVYFMGSITYGINNDSLVVPSTATTILDFIVDVWSNGVTVSNAGVTITDPDTTQTTVPYFKPMTINGVVCDEYLVSPSSISTSGTFNITVKTAAGTATASVDAVTGSSDLATGDLVASWTNAGQQNNVFVDGSAGLLFSQTSATSPTDIPSSVYTSGDAYTVSIQRFNSTTTVSGGAGLFTYEQTTDYDFYY